MKDLQNSTVLGKSFFLIFSISLFVGFYLNEDASGGGTAADFHNTWGYVLALKKDLFVSSEKWSAMFPLHYIILSKLNFIVVEKYSLRLLFCFISLLVPILFYLNLKIKFPNVNKNFLWILASIILILPFFRSSTIWANAHITAFIFFLLSTFFFLKWQKKEPENISLNLILQSLFMALAAYTRQYYVIFFLYYLFVYFQKLKFIDFIKISFIIFLFSIPGFWIIIEYPHYLFQTGSTSFSYKFYNTLLINSSIMSFYLIPLFFISIINNISILKFEKKFFKISLIFFILLVLTLSYSFDYNPSLGGGFFLKVSNLLLHNNILFYLSSMLGFTILAYLCKKNINNFSIIFLLFLSFNVFIIYQKYYEPMFLFIFFLLFESRLSIEFMKNYRNLVYFYFYFFIYLISALTNNIFQIIKNYIF